MDKVIGVETTCHGTIHHELQGQRVIVRAVLKDARAPWHQLDIESPFCVVANDEVLSMAGGLGAYDFVEVCAVVEPGGPEPRRLDVPATALGLFVQA